MVLMFPEEYEEAFNLVKKYCKSPSHDVWHAFRVFNLAMRIQKAEGGNKKIIAYASILHDIADRKVLGEEGLKLIEEFLKQKVSDKEREEIIRIIKSMGFKGALEKEAFKTIEEAIVKDADKLDAIGAVGIARAFTYGGENQRLIFDPNEKVKLHKNREEYLTSTTSTINHFYEKLIHLKGKLFTKTAKEIASKRHDFLILFLEEFFNEWWNND